jgi:hypothetical protein
MSNTKWILSAAAVLGITIALIVIGLDLTSSDPLAGVKAVAIEGVSVNGDEVIPNLPGGRDTIKYGLSFALEERGIRIVESTAEADVIFRLNVNTFHFDDQGGELVATVEMTKSNGEKHSLIFRAKLNFTDDFPGFKFDASLTRS